MDDWMKKTEKQNMCLCSQFVSVITVVSLFDVSLFVFFWLWQNFRKYIFRELPFWTQNAFLFWKRYPEKQNRSQKKNNMLKKEVVNLPERNEKIKKLEISSWRKFWAKLFLNLLSFVLITFLLFPKGLICFLKNFFYRVCFLFQNKAKNTF